MSISVLPLKIWDLSEEVLQWCLASRVPPLQQSILWGPLGFLLGNTLTKRAISPGGCHCGSHAQGRAAGVANAGGRSHQAAPRDSRGDRFLEVIRFVSFLLSRCKSTKKLRRTFSFPFSFPLPCLSSNCQLNSDYTSYSFPLLFNQWKSLFNSLILSSCFK